MPEKDPVELFEIDNNRPSTSAYPGHATRRSITFRMTVAVCAFVIIAQVLLVLLTLVYFKPGKP